MGPLFVIPFQIIFAIIVGVVFGAIVGYWCAPIYYRIRRNSPKNRELKQKRIARIVRYIIALGLSGIILSSWYNDMQNLEDYNKSSGWADWYRWPIEYPYEMTMMDPSDGADLSEWGEQGKTYLNGITRYGKINHYIIGKAILTNLPKDTLLWFTFHLQQENLILFDSQNELRDSLIDIGIEELPEMIPITEHYNRFLYTNESNPLPVIIILLSSGFITFILDRFVWKKINC